MSTGSKDLEGRYIIVTGANTGIGRASAEALARRGAHVVLASRSEEKTVPIVDAIKAAGGSAEFVTLDLGDLTQVKKAAEMLAARDRPLDVLLNNAGVAGQRGQTKQGFELAFGTNHLGHFAFTMPLIPRLREAAAARIVNVSSTSHYDAKGIDFDTLRSPTKTITGLPEYSVSKLANVLFTKELARRLGGGKIRSYALHPGVVASDAWRRIPWPFRTLLTSRMMSIEDGAKTSLYCATSPEVAAHDGRYYDDCREKKPSAPAEDADLGRQLWAKSVEWTGLDLPAA
jgi:NAD(P)-dependent dehydrogenase (short-subunit alcohol dehydrogenase family)